MWSNLESEALLAREGLSLFIFYLRTGDNHDWLRRRDDFRLDLSVQILSCVISAVSQFLVHREWAQLG